MAHSRPVPNYVPPASIAIDPNPLPSDPDPTSQPGTIPASLSDGWVESVARLNAAARDVVARSREVGSRDALSELEPYVNARAQFQTLTEVGGASRHTARLALQAWEQGWTSGQELLRLGKVEH